MKTLIKFAIAIGAPTVMASSFATWDLVSYIVGALVMVGFVLIDGGKKD